MTKINFNTMTFNLLFKDSEGIDVLNTDTKADMRVCRRGPCLVNMIESEKLDIFGIQEASVPWKDYFLNSFPKKYRSIGQTNKSANQVCYIVYNSERFELLEFDYYWLAPGAPKEAVKGWEASHDRLVNQAVFKDIESGLIFIFCNTHFDHISALSRLESAKMVNETVKSKISELESKYSLATVPCIFMGDLNTQPYTESFHELKKYFKDAREEAEGATLNATVSSSPGMQFVKDISELRADRHYIDHILITDGVRVHSVKMIHTSTNLCPYGEYLSDHNAIVANITLNN